MVSDSQIRIIATKPFDDQNPGTSGLRRKLTRFQTPHYVENFVQSIFDCALPLQGKLLVVGGDGRLFNRVACQKVLKMAAANGFGRILVGKGGLLSTPAVSHLIRKYKAHSGIILSASHNPGGLAGDFGIKYDIGNGGPAPEAVTRAIFARSQQIDCYKIVDCPDIDLDHCGRQRIDSMVIDVINPVTDYADLMEEIFDFNTIRAAVAQNLTMCFDAMHAVTGPYAQEIFVKRLGFADSSVINSLPCEDFGDQNPDPTPMNAATLYKLMMSAQAPDLGAACDGDGDRNLIIGRGIFVNASDCLAILSANASYVKAYQQGIVGVARSMPTSSAVDHVARMRQFDLYETPTGWKFFANLLDQGKITLCGEESFGTGSNHLREKDGIWAILFWLNIMAVTGRSVKDIVNNHWREFGRTYYARYDYEGVETARADEMMAALNSKLVKLHNVTLHGMTIAQADNFTYHDPIDHSISVNQGIRILFTCGSRLIFRLSGTGTQGATVRLYLERHEINSDYHQRDVQAVLGTLACVAEELAALRDSLGRDGPSQII